MGGSRYPLPVGPTSWRIPWSGDTLSQWGIPWHTPKHLLGGLRSSEHDSISFLNYNLINSKSGSKRPNLLDSLGSTLTIVILSRWNKLQNNFDFLGALDEGICIADSLCCAKNGCSTDRNCTNVIACPKKKCRIGLFNIGYCINSHLCCAKGKNFWYWIEKKRF